MVKSTVLGDRTVDFLLTKGGRKMLLEKTLNSITDLDQEAMEKAQERLDILTKPQGSLGTLEAIAKQVAGITGNPRPIINKKVVTVMAGDHGVAAEGVSAVAQEVTTQMVSNFVNGGAGINVLARHVGAEVVVVDIGVAADIDSPTVINKKVKKGTSNMCEGPAMTRAEAIKALEAGIEIAEEQIAKGANLLATGDMGIGNTTPSTAILAVFSNIDIDIITGRGTGVDDEGLAKKKAAIAKAIELNQPNREDGIDVLAKVGGLEIAGLAGVILGAAAKRTPVVIDGFISTATALIAKSLNPLSVKYMIPSHSSEEPGHNLMLELLGFNPLLNLHFRLGEGTGAALGMGLVEAATKILNEMATFAEAGVNHDG